MGLLPVQSADGGVRISARRLDRLCVARLGIQAADTWLSVAWSVIDAFVCTYRNQAVKYIEFQAKLNLNGEMGRPYCLFRTVPLDFDRVYSGPPPPAQPSPTHHSFCFGSRLCPQQFFFRQILC